MGRRFSRRILVILFALGLMVWITPPSHAAAPNPQLRLIHASPGVATLDIYVDGNKVASALKFADVSPYATLISGNHRVQVLAVGAGLGGASFIDTTIDLREGQAYTIVAADRPAQMAPVLLDDAPGSVTDGQSRVRLVHASVDAPPLADVAVAGGPVVASDLPFKGSTGYLTVAPGSYRFEVRPAGTIQAIATTETVELIADRTYTAFVIGQFADNTFRALLVPDNADTGGVAAPPTAGGGAMATPPSAASTIGRGLFTLGSIAATILWMRRRGFVRA